MKMSNYERLCKIVGNYTNDFIFNEYPLFDCQKQIELIKLLMEKNCLEGYLYKNNVKKYVLKSALKTVENTNFEEALADLILQLIKTEKLNKEEIKNILGIKEPIIVDNVDVSQCPYYHKVIYPENYYICKLLNCTCHINPNCFFKKEYRKSKNI